MNHSLISVAICTYQGERFLKEQLDSLISQTYTPMEIVIRDDHSTDGTWEIIESFQSKFPHLIRSHRNSIRLGLQINFQLAFQDCRGELIAPCDQDDIWHPEKLDLMSNQMYDHLLIYHDSELIDGSGKKLGKKISDKFRFVRGNDSAAFLLFNCVSGHSLLFKKSLLQDAIPFPPIGYYDHWLAYVASKIGSIDFLGEVLVSFRQHDKNISGYGRKKKYPSRFLASKKRIESENLWIQACMNLKQNQSDDSLECRIANVANIRKNRFIVPSLGWIIWKNRRRLLAILPNDKVQHLALSIRYSWGLKIKKLFNLSI